MTPRLHHYNNNVPSSTALSLDADGSQGGNFPRGGGSPRRPDPIEAGTGDEIPPRGRRGRASNLYRGGGDFCPVGLHGDPTEQYSWADSPP
jgi:hypothetical protein